MLSIVLYGRNDNYGYNLHKRAALSLNCMAEVLSDPDDEILFVDYNTPDDYPTFPEAIADTLTDKAKKYVRVLRVRPTVHARYAKRTHLVALEPVARNIAVRRSNPANRWILSTNTDMIFVPRQKQTLNEIVRDLPKGHYGIPRFEVPETLWEGLDRLDPVSIIDTIGRWGSELHLNEIVAGMKPFLFDAPGDFQLIERSDLFAIHGFDEEMLLGWHVDANMAKRLGLIHGDIGDLTDQLFGYHCDHTRQVTPMHKGTALQNDMNRFFNDVAWPDIPDQAESWGCPEDRIDEIRVSGLGSSIYLQSLSALADSPLSEPRRSAYVPETFGRCDYAPEHVLPFLLDIFSPAPRHWKLAWLGTPGRTLSLFVDGWRKLGFAAKIMLHMGTEHDSVPASVVDHVQWCTYDEMATGADAFVFDFSNGDGGNLGAASVQNRLASRFLIQSFQTIAAAELVRTEEGRAPRRFLGINAIHNQFEQLFNGSINCARTPFSVRIRHGFLIDPGRVPSNRAEAVNGKSADKIVAPASVLQTPISIGEHSRELIDSFAGSSSKHLVAVKRGHAGLVTQSRPLVLPVGHYELAVKCRSTAFSSSKMSLGAQLRISGPEAFTRKLWRYWMVRHVRRAAAKVLGPTVSAQVKSTLRKLLTIGRLEEADLRLDPVLQISVHQGSRLLTQRRALGADITGIPHQLEFEIQTNQEFARSVVISIHSNGGRAFHVHQVHLNKKERAVESNAGDLNRVRGELTAKGRL